ncbi:MAG: class I SAM-dependent methyltransferase [Ferruginibacter sp.]
MIHYKNCPVCKTENIHPAFSAIDFTVTKEEFSIWKCDHCTVMFTQDIPTQATIGRYYQSENYVSHSDTQKGFINQLYHRIRKRTLVKKMQLVETETGLKQGNILDVGCGTGAFLNTMQQAGWKTTGLEPDEGARKTAQASYNLKPLESQKIFELPQNNFNAVTMWHVLEHVHQLHEYIAQLKKVITKEGKIFIAVPNYTSYDASAYQAYWAAYDVPRLLYHFSPKSMAVLMDMHGMKVRKMKPMWFDAFYVSMLSEQCKNDKGNIVKAFFVGLVSNLKTLFDKTKCSSLIYIISVDHA